MTDIERFKAFFDEMGVVYTLETEEAGAHMHGWGEPPHDAEVRVANGVAFLFDRQTFVVTYDIEFGRAESRK